MGSALKNLTEDESTLDQYILTQEQIEKGMYERSEIFELMNGDQILGPFLNQDLKEYMTIHNLFSQEIRVKNIDDEEWLQASTHPYFQRRRPSLVSTKNISELTEKFYILNEGKKEGPFTKEQVNTMLDAHQILATHFVSVDGGQSWGKLFEIEGFDRRIKNHDSLPFRPNNTVFTNSIFDADKAISLAQSKAAETDAIVGLAYIGHLNEGKKKMNIENIQSTPVALEENEDQTSKSSSILNIFFGVCIVVGVYFIYDNFSGQMPETLTTPAQEVSKEEFQANKPVAKVKERNQRTPTRAPSAKNKIEVKKSRIVTRSSESIKKAEFLKHDLSEGEVVEVPPEAIFDDANEAVELDPIRSRISKETLNAEGNEMTNDEANSFKSGLSNVDDQGNAQDEFNDAQSESIDSFE